MCFQLLKYRGTENRAAGLPAGVGWGPWQGAMGVRARGGAGVHTGYIATAYLYIPGCTPVPSPYSRSVP